jgi:hypothetical protein
MVKTTRARRVALKELYNCDLENYIAKLRKGKRPPSPLTYRQLRKSITPLFGGRGCVMVPLWGMWIGIETDGYTHS